MNYWLQWQCDQQNVIWKIGTLIKEQSFQTRVWGLGTLLLLLVSLLYWRFLSLFNLTVMFLDHKYVVALVIYKSCDGNDLFIVCSRLPNYFLCPRCCWNMSWIVVKELQRAEKGLRNYSDQCTPSRKYYLKNRLGFSSNVSWYNYLLHIKLPTDCLLIFAKSASVKYWTFENLFNLFIYLIFLSI